MSGDSAAQNQPSFPVISQNTQLVTYRQPIPPTPLVPEDDDPKSVLPYTITVSHPVNPRGRTDSLVALCFVIGRHIRYFTASFKRMIAEGYKIDNHTYSHKVLTTMSEAEALADIRRNADLIAQ
jgi:hypothetical protein